jgi:hypothetical protein
MKTESITTSNSPKKGPRSRRNLNDESSNSAMNRIISVSEMNKGKSEINDVSSKANVTSYSGSSSWRANNTHISGRSTRRGLDSTHKPSDLHNVTNVPDLGHIDTHSSVALQAHNSEYLSLHTSNPPNIEDFIQSPYNKSRANNSFKVLVNKSSSNHISTNNSGSSYGMITHKSGLKEGVQVSSTHENYGFIIEEEPNEGLKNLKVGDKTIMRNANDIIHSVVVSGQDSKGSSDLAGSDMVVTVNKYDTKSHWLRPRAKIVLSAVTNKPTNNPTGNPTPLSPTGRKGSLVSPKTAKPPLNSQISTNVGEIMESPNYKNNSRRIKQMSPSRGSNKSAWDHGHDVDNVTHNSEGVVKAKGVNPVVRLNAEHFGFYEEEISSPLNLHHNDDDDLDHNGNHLN